MRKCKCEHWQSCPECTSAVRLAQIEIERLRSFALAIVRPN